MTTEIWVTKARYERNASSGVDVFTDRTKLAEHVLQEEACGATVQVYVCKPVKHDAYVMKAGIELYESE